jgi:hypothetical protein
MANQMKANLAAPLPLLRALRCCALTRLLARAAGLRCALRLPLRAYVINLV